MKDHMIAYEDALAKILSHARPLAKRIIRLERATGYFLAQNITARQPSPRFDNSEMDGFGMRFQDQREACPQSPVVLPLVASVRAGGSIPRDLPPRSAVRIMTGAPIPAGVETVLIKEVCEDQGNSIVIKHPAPIGANIRRQGQEFTRGTVILLKGTFITPPVVGLLASLGYDSILVHCKPQVTLLVTGDELVAPGNHLRSGQIFDSNSYALAAACKGLGIDQPSCQRVRDNPMKLRQKIQNALAHSDVVITVGGASVGDYDFVKGVAGEVGVQTVFSKVAMKPGKPNYFGFYRPHSSRPDATKTAATSTKKLVFGLPGNPVSALISFHQLVRPALLKLAGQPHAKRCLLPATIASEWHKDRGRLEWLRGELKTDGQSLIAIPAETQKSYMLGGLAKANCLINFPAALTALGRKGMIQVELFTWGGPLL